MRSVRVVHWRTEAARRVWVMWSSSRVDMSWVRMEVDFLGRLKPGVGWVASEEEDCSGKAIR
jgi:hypothetical protein